MSVPVQDRWRALARPDVLLAALFAAHVVVKSALYFHVWHTPVVGDEAAYVDGARALSNLVRDLSALGPVDVAELQRSVVGSGWFMPGMSVSITPLFVVDPDASIGAIRAYLGVVSTLLLLLTALSVRRVLGPRYAAALLVFPGLVPMWLMFSFAAWGDLCAGLLVVLMLVRLVALVRLVRAGLAPTVADGLRLGLLAVGVVYLRSSAVLVIVGLCSVLGIAVLARLRGHRLWRGLASLAAAAAAFVAVLAPWSAFASDTLGGRVITTTSVPVVMANTFGDPDLLCFGPCDAGSTIWFNPLRYSREVAAATGHSEVEVQQQMSAYARGDVTAHSYADDVVANVGRYALDPAGFEPYLASPDAGGGVVSGLISGITEWMFFALLAAAVAMLVAVVRRRPDDQVLAIMLKVGLLALFTQPFVHICGSRYWTTAAPLFALAAALAWGVWVSGRRGDREQGGPGDRPLERWLTGAQVALTAVVVVVVAGVVALSS